MAKKGARLFIRLSTPQLETLRAGAKRQHESVSEFVRGIALEFARERLKAAPPEPGTAARDAIARLRRVEGEA